MTTNELLFFEKMPEILPLYTVFKEKLQSTYPKLEYKVTKTQISVRNRYVFVMASLPWRRVKGWPEQYLLISFGLPYQKKSPRVAQSVEAYRGRWTHHVIVKRKDELDEELMGWIQEAYAFAMIK